MGRRSNQISKYVKDKLLVEEIIEIKKELSRIQNLLNKGEIEESRRRLEDIVLRLSILSRNMKDPKIERELSLAEWHLDRAITMLMEKRR